jgi:LacI family transcriptional regulator, gluconate utilization system Gnt-I transcriptional repressor
MLQRPPGWNPGDPPDLAARMAQMNEMRERCPWLLSPPESRHRLDQRHRSYSPCIMATRSKTSGKTLMTRVRKPRKRQRTVSHSLDSVARIAGVSPATVSRVINEPQLVAAATVARVRTAISRSGYVPNRIAGGLASSRTGLIAVIVPSIVHSVFNDTIQAMTEELTRAGYQVMLGLSGYDPGDIGNMLLSILSRRPDGVILTGFAGEPAVRKQLRAMGVPVIETWALPARPLDMAVGFSHEAIGHRLADLLIARGYRSPLLLSAEGPRARARRDALCQRFVARGLGMPACHGVPMPSTVTHGRAGFAHMLRSGQTHDVVICSSDWLALGVMIEARQHGLAIPGDIGIVGFGNLDFAAELEPALTTLHVDGAEIGRQSARLLLARARGERGGSRFVDVGTKIIERASLRAPAAGP